MTARARFKQSDVTRIFQGAAKAGVELSRIEVCPHTGRIMAFTGPPTSVTSNDPEEPNEWDDVLNLG